MASIDISTENFHSSIASSISTPVRVGDKLTFSLNNVWMDVDLELSHDEVLEIHHMGLPDYMPNSAEAYRFIKSNPQMTTIFLAEVLEMEKPSDQKSGFTNKINYGGGEDLVRRRNKP